MLTSYELILDQEVLRKCKCYTVELAPSCDVALVALPCHPWIQGNGRDGGAISGDGRGHLEHGDVVVEAVALTARGHVALVRPVGVLRKQ